MRPPSRLALLRPRNSAALLAIACVGLALGYAVSQEPAMGRVRGKVLISETNSPIGGAEVVMVPIYTDGEIGSTRRVTSAVDGQFTLPHVPAGSYYVSASTRAHQVSDSYVTVDEGGTTDVSLTLDRSQPELQLAQHQRVFATSEKAYLPVKGYIDPTKPAGQDDLKLRVYRTRLSNVLQQESGAQTLEKIGSSYGEPLVDLPASLIEPTSGEAPKLITNDDVRLNDADREGFYYKRIDFGSLAPGLYLVDMKHGKAGVAAWLLVTDTALVAKRARNQMLAYAVDMKSGAPLPGSDVRAYRGGQVVAQGRTDSQGLAQLTVPKSEDRESKLLLVAIRGEDEAVVNREYYGSEESDRNQFTLAAYTDRPIYRPGQTIFYKGIVRRTVEPGAKYAIPSGAPVAVEIRDPIGERLQKTSYTPNAYGSFHGSIELSPEASTGVYTMAMRVGATEETHSIVIASYKKPEFAVTVTPDKKRYTRGESVTMTISGQFYFGAPVAGGKVKYDVYRAPDWAADYPEEYEYDEEQDRRSSHSGEGDEGGDYYGQTVTRGDATLDENGQASISFRADTPESASAPSEELYRVHVSVEDESHRAVESDGEARVSAGDFRLTVSPEGYVGAPGAPTSVFLTARDFDGRPVANLPIDLEIGVEQRNDDKFEFKRADTLHATTGPDGKAVIAVTPAKAGEIRLTASARDSHGHTVRGRAYLWAADDTGGDLQTEYADLSLLTDKRRYKPGETARVLINSVRTGQSVLVTVEGDKIYRAFLVPMTKRSTIVRVPVLADYGPNVSLAACYVRDKHFAASEIPLRVTVPEREVTVHIQSDRARYHPGDKITYDVQTLDSKGRPIPCELSFGVVDEAIYALREDNPTQLRDAFYPRRQNQVNTEYSFAIEYLGDADKAEPKIVARKRFPDTAHWVPDLLTDSQGHATISFQLPDSLTTWRATAVAQTTDTAFGRETNEVIVAKEFFVRVETPRFLTQRDQSQIVALVHNETGSPQTALVRLRADHMTLGGNDTQTLKVDPGKVGQAVWPVTAADLGDAKLIVTAWTPKTAPAPQWTDGVETSLPIKPHGREQVTAFAGELTSGKPENEVLRLDPAAIPGATRLTVRITPSITSSLVGALDYLIDYPYGCTEQTMSRLLPDLLVQRTLRLTGAQSMLTSEEGKKRLVELPKMVRDGLTRLYRFQHESGGWGWWEHDADDPWMTAYVIVGLSTAQSEGYPVGKESLNRALKKAAQMLDDPNLSNSKAFLLYALALAGDKETVRAQRSKVKLDGLNSEALAYLVLADNLTGGVSTDATDLLTRRMISEDDLLHWKSGVYRYASDWDDQTATATGLRALLAVNKTDPRIADVLRWLMVKRTGDYWFSTRDTAAVLFALCDYLKAQPGSASPTGEVRVLLNGKLIRGFAITPDLAREKELVLRVPQAALQPGKNDVTLERAGGGTVFYSVELRQTIASEDIPALSPGGLGIKRDVLRVLPAKIGSDSWTLQTEPTNNQLHQGDRIRVRLTLDVPRDMLYVLIEDPFPAGCEVTERGSADESEDWGFWYSSVDVRDDKIAFFARTLSAGKHTIEYNLRAQTPGTYHTLPSMLQAMYDPETRAESAETRVEVR